MSATPGEAQSTAHTTSSEPPKTGAPTIGLAAKGLDPREKRAGLAGAVLAAVGFTAIWVPHLNQPTPKGHQAAAVYLAIGLIEALVLALCTLARRRYLVGFASLVIGFGPWNAYTVLVVPFLALAGWTIYRASRLSRLAAASSRPAGAKRQGSLRSTRSANRRAAGTAGGPQGAIGVAKGAAQRSSRARSGARGRASQEAVDATGRRRPTASKRYTPPKAVPRNTAKATPKTAARNEPEGAPKGAPKG
ncbi:MAG: hypothetical protein DLM54_02055 [Acidimicrobiales bacterium]|nr:MAG: hypothetical protein DLM54_02055 [Acidimicrobiales bacterium]